MQDEAEITISGVKLTHDESMTVRVAIDTPQRGSHLRFGLLRLF